MVDLFAIGRLGYLEVQQVQYPLSASTGAAQSAGTGNTATSGGSIAITPGNLTVSYGHSGGGLVINVTYDTSITSLSEFWSTPGALAPPSTETEETVGVLMPRLEK